MKRLLLATTVALLAAAAPAAPGPGAHAAAQVPASTLRGTVSDSAGKPVPSQVMLLHRVDATTGGAMVDSATSDAQGRFTLRIKAESDTAAVFIVTTRWQGQLYVGEPFKPPAPPAYHVVVGVNPVNMGPVGGQGGAGGMGGAPGGMAGAPAGMGGNAPPPRDLSGAAGKWLLAILLGIVALVALIYALAGDWRERGARKRRELLLRIAELDERAAAAPPAERAALERERAELVADLRE